MACTEIGGINGIGVGITAALHVESGSVAFESATRTGAPLWSTPWGGSPEVKPSGRASQATFKDLGRRFGPGMVTVTVELKDSTGRSVDIAEREVKLKRSYPNGRFCDGDGYVNGDLTLTIADRT